jgi:hypothetical protein
MYRDNIADLFSQKRESNRFVLTDFILLYIKMKVFVPHFINEREELVRVVSEYFKCDKNESQVLRYINKNFGKIEEEETIDDLLDEFDEMAQNQYNYFQELVIGYESVLEECSSFMEFIFNKMEAIKEGEKYSPFDQWRRRMGLRKMEYQVFDEPFKEETMKKIGAIPRTK